MLMRKAAAPRIWRMLSGSGVLVRPDSSFIGEQQAMCDAQQDYYRDRARAARQMASRAGDRGIRSVHLDLARRYEALANGDETAATADGFDDAGLYEDDAYAAPVHPEPPV